MTKEGQTRPELDRGLVAAYAQTFISRFDCYPLQLPDGQYVAIKRPLTLPMVEAHLLGKHTIGAYALDGQSQARWLCFDADEDEAWQGLVSLAATLAARGVPAYLEQSRRGGHLWLFFAQAIAGRDARRLGRSWLSSPALASVEIYPKQDELRTGVGSLVRLPLGVHRKSGKRYHFVMASGEPLAPTVREQVALLASPATAPGPYVAEALATLPEPQGVLPTPRFAKQPVDRSAKPSERIKAAVSVLEFVRRYVELDPNQRGLCPFHDDQRVSFAVNEVGNYWQCFAGCGGGSIIDFWQRWRALHGHSDDFTATVKELIHLLRL
jgi:hypothetical protein